jgi:ribulose bisphosphate carboxylase small subunit
MMNEITKRHVASIQAPYDTLNTIPGHRYRGWQPCIEWCEQQWGNRGSWFFIGEGVFEFNDERDYLMFLLRWA